MKKLLFVLIALAVMVFPAAALNSVSSLMPYLGDEALKLMTDEGMSLSNSTLGDGIMHLVPIGSKIAQRAIEASGEENSFTVALVGFTAYPESWNNLSQEERMVKLLSLPGMNSLSITPACTRKSDTSFCCAFDSCTASFFCSGTKSALPKVSMTAGPP